MWLRRVPLHCRRVRLYRHIGHARPSRILSLISLRLHALCPSLVSSSLILVSRDLNSLVLTRLVLTSLVLTSLVLASLSLIASIALACRGLCRCAVRLWSLFCFRRRINHRKHSNLRGICCCIRNIPRRRKLVLVTLLAKTVVLCHSLGQGRGRRIQPIPSHVHSVAIDRPQALSGSGHRHQKQADDECTHENKLAAL